MAPKKPKSQPKQDRAALEQILGHTFARPDLLTLALTHRSFVYDQAASPESDNLADPSHDNEQLEFVGDAALGLIVADALCQRFPHSREGELTRLRANLVSRKHLGAVGTRLNLGRWLRLGHTAEKNDGRHNAALFSNAIEALIAALYLDAGLETARRFVDREILANALPGLAESISGDTTNGGFSEAVGDHKSALQEFLQAAALGRPQYVAAGESGPDHQRTFVIQVELHGEILASAQGTTKKQAQQEAARLAVDKLRKRAAIPSTGGDQS